MSVERNEALFGRLSAIAQGKQIIYSIDILPPESEQQKQMFGMFRNWEEIFSVLITDDRTNVPIELLSHGSSIRVRIISLHESVERLEGILSELRKFPALSARIYASTESAGGKTVALILRESPAERVFAQGVKGWS